MLKREENELITRVGPGTPMGNTMRRYWMPVVLSSSCRTRTAIPSACACGRGPDRLRDTNGQVGLVAANCPHRGASLFFGRNEAAGLRCVYHGWKFDTTGQCVDMPNEPAESDFRTQSQSRGLSDGREGRPGLGLSRSAGKATTVPDLEFMRARKGIPGCPRPSRTATTCSSMEGGLDTSHSSFCIALPTLRDWRTARAVDRATARVLNTDYG